MSTLTTLIKAFVATAFALLASTSFAAVDANQASQAELESVKSIGPSIAGRILDERKKSPFKDWNDMIDRVKGVGEGNAARFSANGLTVNGGGFSAAAATPKEAKRAAGADGKDGASRKDNAATKKKDAEDKAAPAKKA